MTLRHYMLDTNMASFILRGRDDVALQRRLLTIPLSQISLSVISEAELLFGLAKRPGATALKKVVHEFLLRVTVLPWDSAAAGHYGDLRAKLEKRGLPLGSMDTMIAAHALAVSAILVTNDQAFRRVPGLSTEDWKAG